MENRINNKKVLEKAPGAFKELHKLCGFDFQAEHLNIHVMGGWTVKRIYDFIRNHGGDAENSKMIVLVDIEYHGFGRKFGMIGIEAGKIEIDYKPDYKSGLDHYYCKRSAEDARKNAKNSFIICQNKQLLKPYKEKTIDLNQRFKIDSKESITRCASSVGGASWIGRIPVICTDGSARKTSINNRGFIYNWNRFYNDRCENKTNNINDIIDKSGYIIASRRDDLRRAADELRAERAKNEYLNSNKDAEKIAEAEKALQDVKQEFIQALTAAGNYEKMRKIASALYYKLDGCYLDLQFFRENCNNKKFSSIASFNNSFDRLIQRIAAARAALMEA